MKPAVIPLSLYIHIPWCVRKCPYCDFNSHQVRLALPERAYVDALLADLEQDLPQVWGRRVESIFIGGGTPSLFSAQSIDRLLSGLRARLTLRPDLEITLEANPGTVEQQKFRAFRAAGINRLSIGIQSFNPEHLQRLGRIHDHDEAVRAVEAAHGAGFDNFNVDLMFGLPEQSVDQALADIHTAIALKPTHISHYQLTLEPNTRFHKYPPPLPEDDDIWVMQEHCQEQLAQGGYDQYEVSAYARAGKRCRHNLNYWEFGDYLGIGAGAHGKITDPASGHITRLWKPRHPRSFLIHAGSSRGIDSTQQIRAEDIGLEFMINALRLTDGFPEDLFEERTHLSLAQLEPALSIAQERDLLIRDAGHIRVTHLGQRFLNNLIELFIGYPSPVTAKITASDSTASKVLSRMDPEARLSSPPN